MQEKLKNIFVIVEFVAILAIILIVNIVKEDEKISIIERRKLAEFPEFTVNSVFTGKASNDFEKYVTDQFIGRDTFKEIKYWFSVNVLGQKDDNNLFVKDGSIYKMVYPLNEKAVESSTEKLEDIYNNHLQGMNVYYSIIPDKNYYLKDEHLKIDYSKMEKILKNKLEGAKYIDIKDTLSTESFYKTDLHWKQEDIINTVDVIKKDMGLDTKDIEYIEKEAGSFYGVYYGQAGTNIKPDTIKYLTNDIIENCKTHNYETNKQSKVYDLDKYNNSQDKYDVFVSGPTPLITIENPNSTTDKELLLFRDSFGSSLAPLLIDDYKKITLIDIRYMSRSLLTQYIEFKEQDVLFLYSGLILNQNILK